jgi:hypothetical protein
MTQQVLLTQVDAGSLSPDGYFFWDGAQWAAAISPDGFWRWDGAAWVPAARSSIAAGRPYASARTLGVLVSVLLALCIAVAFVQVFVYDPYFQGWLALGDQTVHYTFDIAGLVSLLVAAPLFLVWFHRAYRNAAGLGARGLQLSSGWAVGWWFVPIACFWMPLLAAIEMWRTSGALEAPDDGTSGRPDAAPVLVGVWWAAWLLFLVMANVTAVLDNPDDNSFLLSAVSNASTVLAAVLAIIVVMTVSARQDARWRQPPQST